MKFAEIHWHFWKNASVSRTNLSVRIAREGVQIVDFSITVDSSRITVDYSSIVVDYSDLTVIIDRNVTIMDRNATNVKPATVQNGAWLGARDGIININIVCCSKDKISILRFFSFDDAIKKP